MPHFRRMSMGPETFLRMPGVSGLRLWVLTHLKLPCSTPARLVGRATNTVLTGRSDSWQRIPSPNVLLLHTSDTVEEWKYKIIILYIRFPRCLSRTRLQGLMCLCYVLTFWPGQKCHSRWCTGRKWHIPVAGNRKRLRRRWGVSILLRGSLKVI